MCSAARNQLRSPLLRLPAELRNIIYTMALQEGCIEIASQSVSLMSFNTILRAYRYSSSPDEPTGIRYQGSYTSFASVCRQMYSETCLLPYTLNTFCFDSHKAMQTWMSCRLAVQRHAITSFKPPTAMIREYIKKQSSTFKKWLPKLKTLYLDLWAPIETRARTMMDEDITSWIEQRKQELEKREGPGVVIIVTKYNISRYFRRLNAGSPSN